MTIDPSKKQTGSSLIGTIVTAPQSSGSSSTEAQVQSQGNDQVTTRPASVITNTVADRLEIEAQIAKQHINNDFDYGNGRSTRNRNNNRYYSGNNNTSSNRNAANNRANSLSYRQYYEEMRGTPPLSPPTTSSTSSNHLVHSNSSSGRGGR